MRISDVRITEAASTLLSVLRAPESVQDLRLGRWSWTGPACLVLLLVGMLTVVVVRNGISSPDLSPPPLLVGVTVLSWLPLLWRVRRPRTALVGTVAAESLHIALVPVIDGGVHAHLDIAAYQPVPLATMAAAWAVASRTGRGWVWGVAGAAALFGVGLVTRPLDLLVTDLVMFNLVVMATGAGAWVTGRRERAQRRDREQREQTRRLVTDERLRIARDLHDVLAHHLALVNAQAGVAAYLVHTDPATAATALDDMARHTRQALDGLRATVGLLRQDPAPGAGPGEQPDLLPPPDVGRLENLLAAARAAGTAVTLDVTGTPRPLGPDADLATYRIVQEALTNATKHAPGAPVAVTLDWRHDRLGITVRNDPPPIPQAVPAPGSGHGLLGMRERALACGGSLDVDRSAGGGFLVRASIPTQPEGQPAGRSGP